MEKSTLNAKFDSFTPPELVDKVDDRNDTGIKQPPLSIANALSRPIFRDLALSGSSSLMRRRHHGILEESTSPERTERRRRKNAPAPMAEEGDVNALENV